MPVVPAPRTMTAAAPTAPGDPARTRRALDSLAAALHLWAPRAAALTSRLTIADAASTESQDEKPAQTPPGTPAEIPVDAAHDATLPAEGYTLHLAPAGWTLRAGDEAGAFWAVQTLGQLLRDGQVPAVDVADHPTYPVRGVMLDVARSFFGPADIRRVVDLAAAYKLNQLHLHLSDDQGWRLEIEGRPLLTELASGSAVSGGTGGFLTLAEYDELQDYAIARHVQIVPEIDLPGHTHAAQVAYPEASPDGEPREPYLGTEVGFSALHLTSPASWDLVRDVVATLARHTRGGHVHLGGDESLTLSREDYVTYMERLGAVAAEHGVSLTLWQEAAGADLPAGTRLQYWTSEIATDHLAAVARDHDVTFVASPASRAYLDQKYDPDFPLGLSWAATIELEEAYSWDPVSALPGIPAASIVGVEGCLWAETLRSLDDVTTMLLPRLPAVASVAWGSAPDFARFTRALVRHGAWWQADGLAFHRSPAVDWV